jgi:hypothetical protein
LSITLIAGATGVKYEHNPPPPRSWPSSGYFAHDAEADISRRVNEMQDELARLQEAAAEADREYKDALWEDDDDDDDDNGESLSLGDAKDIWLSKGMDEDYTFGYSEEELRREAGLDCEPYRRGRLPHRREVRRHRATAPRQSPAAKPCPSGSQSRARTPLIAGSVRTGTTSSPGRPWQGSGACDDQPCNSVL